MSVEHFKVIVAAALIDGKLDAQEKPLLFKAAGELGIPEAEVQAIVKEVAKGGKVKGAIPKDAKARAQLFRSLVDVVAADGTIAAKELAFFNKIAPQFGLGELELEDILRASGAELE